jgi:hypothetical protein
VKYPIDVNGLIRAIELRLKEGVPEKREQILKGFLACLYTLKEQGLEKTDTSKISLKELMDALGIWEEVKE